MLLAFRPGILYNGLLLSLFSRAHSFHLCYWMEKRGCPNQTVEIKFLSEPMGSGSALKSGEHDGRHAHTGFWKLNTPRMREGFSRHRRTLPQIFKKGSPKSGAPLPVVFMLVFCLAAENACLGFRWEPACARPRAEHSSERALAAMRFCLAASSDEFRKYWPLTYGFLKTTGKQTHRTLKRKPALQKLTRETLLQVRGSLSQGTKLPKKLFCNC